MDLTVAFIREFGRYGEHLERAIIAGAGVLGAPLIVQGSDGTLHVRNTPDETGKTADLEIDGSQYRVTRTSEGGWSCTGGTQAVSAGARARVSAVMDEVLARYWADEGVRTRLQYRATRALSEARHELADAQEDLADAESWVTSATAKVQAAEQALSALAALPAVQTAPQER